MTTPRRAAILGHPVAHSLSPVLHGAAYADLGIEHQFSFGPADVEPADLARFLDSLDDSWAGLSVTMPHKQAIIEHLDLLAPTARVTNSVNTVVVLPGGPNLLGGELDAGPRPAGRPGLLAGLNTDVYGIVSALREELGGREVGERSPKRGVIIGARATASSALAALDQLGVADVTVIARTLDGPGSVRDVAQRLGRSLDHRTFDQHEEIRKALQRADVVVSTVPQGVADQLAPHIAGSDLTDRVLLDAVYDPWPTVVAEAWQGAGGSIAPGWSMLLHQAWLQVRLMTGGLEPDVDVMRSALRAALDARPTA